MTNRAAPAPGEPNTGLLLYLPYREMEARVFQAVQEAGFTDLTLAQGRVFQRIGAEGTRLTALAEQARVSKQTAAVLVQALETAGYVRRIPDPTDARARLVCVAERGTAAVAVAAETVQAVEAEWRAHVGSAAYARLRDTLQKLREISDPYQGVQKG
ncbi:MarR family transcriptional regulator [Arthrobacter sp. Sa2CUA1]|uniref:MarR family transcriptional regulator n=1 Tax=Arthrobacter gallicola TaxID=2762225 RepID=A0ABR8UTI2_9MICC|nr:MarR family transcriptional regulator [Arthrobacter gallicola]MBD7995833.1 MarR family transcriptional regulator [Arthrobacter gallicola]